MVFAVARLGDRRAVALGLIAIAVAGGCGASGGATPDAAAVSTRMDLGLPLPDAPVTVLAGEIHLHQFPAGSHAWAAFLADPVPLADVHTDEIVELQTAPTAADGPCILYRSPTCAHACDATSYCAGPDTCRALPTVRYVDGGPIVVTGSKLQPRIRMWFTSADSGYATDPPPGSALLFAGGETLFVEGGAGDDRIEGVLPAPMPVVMLRPDPAAALHFPTGDAAPYEVRWEPGDATDVVVTLSASRNDGAFATIRCVVSDGGALTVGADLIAGLPPPPRDIRLEVERDQPRILETLTPGRGILAHAAFSAWQNGTD